VLGVVPVQAETQTPTPSPTPTPAPLLGGGFTKHVSKQADDPPTQQRADAQKAKGSPTPIVITDANIQRYARKSPDNTFTDKKRATVDAAKMGKRSGSSSPALTPTATASSSADKKQYWQERYRTNKQKIERLEREIPEYKAARDKAGFDAMASANPDPHDSYHVNWANTCEQKYQQAQAALDRKLKELEEARGEKQRIITEGRRDGAEPGWFR